jgi:hypothetical protein
MAESAQSKQKHEGAAACRSTAEPIHVVVHHFTLAQFSSTPSVFPADRALRESRLSPLRSVLSFFCTYLTQTTGHAAGGTAGPSPAWC